MPETATELPCRRRELVIVRDGEPGRYVVKDPGTGGTAFELCLFARDVRQRTACPTGLRACPAADRDTRASFEVQTHS